MRRSALTPLLGLSFLVLAAGCGSTGQPSPAPGANAESPSQTAPARTYNVVEPRLSAMQEDNEVFTLETDFAEDRPGTELRVEGVSYPLDRREGTSYVFRNVRVPKLGENNAKIELPTGRDLPPRVYVEFKIHREMRTADEYRKYASPLDYKLVMKNPDRFAGTFVKGRGKIYQITESGWATDGGLNVRNLGYGYWDDNMRFTMSKLTDFVQDDVVSFYGKITGSHTYETTAGWNLTVPMIEIEFMERG